MSGESLVVLLIMGGYITFIIIVMINSKKNRNKEDKDKKN